MRLSVYTYEWHCDVIYDLSVAVAPRLETLENLMKLHAMIVQAVWECKSPFLMLPHITQDHLRHFITKKVSRSNFVFRCSG